MVNIVNVRIDERLIHGQVAAYWTNNLNVTRLMVIDDLASQDEIQKMALKMACPSTVKLSILSVDRAVERLNDPTAYEGERVFIVLRGTETLEKVIEKGAPIKNITVGNMSNKVGSTRVYHTVCVTQDDIRRFRELADKGITFTAQMVPSDEPQNFIDLIAKL
ncbi:PTS system mannose/fructose/N-acetylgalactosamine-transporter subunit IIB [Anaerorhabdus furcosa]|uniref:PTS system, mannose-specific IIB component n=1 Tax=Anaerorhabdus furcosa TaxID=118967 RepID=A0A1T4MXI5_9FIRM|nr:PTS sugar transporter subunit IIB [Anaerorhabdus furcosa]SJZ71368.1 PTS system, mannose-specific IIB component [Anaerorhabdus furcosa]